AQPRDRQRHARRRDRTGSSALGRRDRALGDRPRARRVGSPARSRLRRRRAASPQISWMDAAMMNFSEYRSKSACLADFLPWACLVAERVVLNKDGSFLRSERFRGPDLDSATPAEMGAVTARLNSALRRLGSGWAVFVEA